VIVLSLEAKVFFLFHFLDRKDLTLKGWNRDRSIKKIIDKILSQ